LLILACLGQFVLSHLTAHCYFVDGSSQRLSTESGYLNDWRLSATLTTDERSSESDDYPGLYFF